MEPNIITSSFLQGLSNHDLIARTKGLRNEESKTTALLCAHLAEVYRRRLFLEYEANMYAYCQNHLGLTDGEMALRVQVAKKGVDCPQLLEAMARGCISLSVAAKLCPYLGGEAAVEPDKLIKDCEGMSKRRVEEYLVSLAPKPLFLDSFRAAPSVVASRRNRGQGVLGDGLKETEKAMSGDRDHLRAKPEAGVTALKKGEIKPATTSAYNIRFAASKQFKEKFDRLKELVDKNQGLSLQDVFEYALDYTLNNKDPKRRKQRRDQRQVKNPARPDDQPVTPENNRNQPKHVRAHGEGGAERKRSGTNERFLPRKLQDETFARAQYQCEYKSHTGRRCSARANLHIDHKKPLAFGGKTERDNLQCLCASHHRQKTERELGKTFIAEKILERRKMQGSSTSDSTTSVHVFLGELQSSNRGNKRPLSV